MSENWREHARCGGDPELFFPVGTTGPAVTQTEKAKATCQRCPVISECLTWALEHPKSARHGVWGGTDEDERRAMLRRRQRAQARTR